MPKVGYVYIMTNQPNGILYTGVTNDIIRRAWQHKNGVVDSFTKEHGIKLLAWCEVHETVTAAIAREKCIKHWKRAWKVKLILEQNPTWEDLAEKDGFLI